MVRRFAGVLRWFPVLALLVAVEFLFLIEGRLSVGEGANTFKMSVQGLPLANGVQIKVKHGADDTYVAALQCTGVFSGALPLGPVSVQGGTLVGCYYSTPGTYAQGSGEVIQLTIHNSAVHRSCESLQRGMEVGFETAFSKDGETVSPPYLSCT